MSDPKGVSQVRAKFVVQGVEQQNDGYHVTLYPVTDGSTENENFYRWTRGGQILLGLVSPTTTAYFIPGQEYYVDFTRAHQYYVDFTRAHPDPTESPT